MYKKILLVTMLILSATTVNAQIQKVNLNQKLQAKKVAVEDKLNQKQDETLAKIDAKIAKAKATGKSTENLEKKRAEVIARISAKENELNTRINSQKKKIVGNSK